MGRVFSQENESIRDGGGVGRRRTFRQVITRPWATLLQEGDDDDASGTIAADGCLFQVRRPRRPGLQMRHDTAAVGLDGWERFARSSIRFMSTAALWITVQLR